MGTKPNKKEQVTLAKRTILYNVVRKQHGPPR